MADTIREFYLILRPEVLVNNHGVAEKDAPALVARISNAAKLSGLAVFPTFDAVMKAPEKDRAIVFLPASSMTWPDAEWLAYFAKTKS